MSAAKIAKALFFIVTVAACDGPERDGPRHSTPGSSGDNNPNGDPKANANPQACNDNPGKSYTGFGGTKLEEKRVDAKAGLDRTRIKPYAALAREYDRTIGAVPSSLDSAAGSFGEPADRWSQEPTSSAISVWTSFQVGFDGCLSMTQTPAEFAAAPTEETATATCTKWTRKFWSRNATADEINECKQVALTDSASETQPRRRWAYTCAALLSSAGFLTY